MKSERMNKEVFIDDNPYYEIDASVEYEMDSAGVTVFDVDGEVVLLDVNGRDVGKCRIDDWHDADRIKAVIERHIEKLHAIEISAMAMNEKLKLEDERQRSARP